MKKYELNNLGNDWIFEAENEEEATKQLIEGVCNAKNINEYLEYCKSVGVDSKIEWTQV